MLRPKPPAKLKADAAKVNSGTAATDASVAGVVGQGVVSNMRFYATFAGGPYLFAGRVDPSATLHLAKGSILDLGGRTITVSKVVGDGTWRNGQLIRTARKGLAIGRGEVIDKLGMTISCPDRKRNRSARVLTRSKGKSPCASVVVDRKDADHHGKPVRRLSVKVIF